MPLEPGARLGPYEVLDHLGSGGMAEIYRARDVRLEREVAIKILPEALAADRAALARLEHEARSASALNHPHLVTIHDIGEAAVDGQAVRYVAMELIRGSTLRTHMESDPLAVLLRHLANVADGLACAHDHGIVHRDLKPENVMVSADGFAKVVDFGLAKQIPIVLGEATAKFDGRAHFTTQGMVVGTIGYMSPEQVTGLRQIDHRSDVFAFGCMLHEVVANEPPFDGENPIDVMYDILHKEPAPLAHPSLDRIARRCLAKKPEQRYASMHEVAADIRGVVETTDVRRALRFRPRHPRRWLIAAAAAVLVVIAAAIVGTQGRAPAIDSIAVLPFTGAAPEMEFLGDGMADDIVRDLSRNADLRVIANSSTARYRGAKDPRAVARELNVDAVLMTKMTAGSGLLSLDTQLVRAADGSLLWGSKYARSLGDATALAHEVVSDLSTRARLDVAPQRAQTRNPEAYASYQRGRHAAQKETAPSLKVAISHYQHALGLDPDYAQAWAALAHAHGRQAVLGLVPTAEGLRQEKAEAERAVAIDDTLAEGHWYLALVAEVTGNDERYEREEARVLELDPNFAEAWLYRANRLLLQQKFEEAERVHQRARALDPMSPHVLSSYAAHLMVTRQYDRAVSVLFNLTEQFPDYATGVASLAMVYSAMGRHADALAQIERANVALNPNFLVWKGIILARAGRIDDARAVARQIDDAATVRFFPPYYRAMLSAELGDRDAALSLLEQVKRNNDWQVKWLPFEKSFDPLRGDARFATLIR